MPQQQPAVWLIMLLAAVIATTPLAIDMYLPAMPMMARDLDTTVSMIQQSLSIYLAAFAIGMLLAGPLADSLGRRPLAMFGLTGFMVASMAIGFSTSVEELLFWRAAQAFCGSAATVVVPGIVRHLYKENTAKGMSYVAMIMMLAPLIAPTFGSGILLIGSWQMIFIAMGIYSLIVLVLCWFFLPEIKPAGSPRNIAFLDGYKTIYALPAAWPYIATTVSASFSFFCFLTAVSFVYIDYFGVSEQTFALLFGANVVILMLANFINSRLVTRLKPHRMLKFTMLSASIFAVLLVLFNYLQLGLWFTVVAIAPLLASLSLSATNSDAITLMKFPEHTGTATAVTGTLRFGFGALAGPLLAFMHDGTPLPFALLMLAGVICIAGCQLWAKCLR